MSEATRKDIVDWLVVEAISWSGRLSDEPFLDRVVDLDALPSTDPRFQTARLDLRQHRVNNDDWPDDWVFSYSPIALTTGSDEVFLRFLCAMLHPVVRSDSEDARRLASELNDLLRTDGIELYEASAIGTRPVWAFRQTGSPERGLVGTYIELAGDAPPHDSVSRIWDTGTFRLFLSHVSAHKVAVSALKRELRPYGVCAFVAHEDIEPSREWESEIRLALASMDALTALVTPDFHNSHWTDHEVGIAIGRRLLVLPVRLPTTPYGFMARHQALTADIDKPRELASALVDVLLKRSETGDRMRDALVLAVERSPSFIDTKLLINRVETTTGFTNVQLARLSTAIVDNDQVGSYIGVGRLRRYVDAKQT